jgi:hypothetical protein
MKQFHCFECSDGTMREVVKEYRMETKHGLLVVPDVPIMCCDKCDGECYDMHAARKIDEAHRVLRNCKGFRPLRKADGSYSKRCADCGWMEQDH